MARMDCEGIATFIEGHQVSAERIRAWEAHRIRAVFRTLTNRLGHRAARELLDGSRVVVGNHPPDERVVDAALGNTLEDRRNTLTTMKAHLGPAGIYALLRRDLAISATSTRAAVAVSRGRRSFAVTRLEAPGRSAERFADWFTAMTLQDRQSEMVAACPDHYLLRRLADGRQEVVETTGGSPTASRFIVDYDRTEDLSIPIDSAYPVQVAGQALLDDGTVIGGVRHQFRDRDGALDALLTVEFPAAVPARMIREHRWHLAVEFGNWIDAFTADESSVHRPRSD
ncbi:hypothetical protein GCM10009624_36140 [Gordonia sinesedis]